MLVCAGRRDVYFDVWMFLLKEGKRCRKHINAAHTWKGNIENPHIPLQNISKLDIKIGFEYQDFFCSFHILFTGIGENIFIPKFSEQLLSECIFKIHQKFT